MPVLSEADWRFWEENGYVIVPEAVPRPNLEAVIRAIWEFQEMDPQRPETWYREPERENGMPELNRAGMVEMYHHQSLWDNRQYPRVYEAFAEIWKTPRLWVSIDRVNLNVPVRPGWDFQGFIHWDIDTSLKPIPFEVQGVLSLADTPVEQGGFQCIPGFHRRLEEWIPTQPADRDPWRPDIRGLEVKAVSTRAGDLLIWNSALPHGTSRNLSGRPRLAQYITMFPARESDTSLRDWRIRSWRECLKPEGFAFPGDPRDWERKNGRPARLSPLGERLLGSRSWEPGEAD